MSDAGGNGEFTAGGLSDALGFGFTGHENHGRDFALLFVNQVREYVAFIGAKVRLDEAIAGEQVGQADVAGLRTDDSTAAQGAFEMVTEGKAEGASDSVKLLFDVAAFKFAGRLGTGNEGEQTDDGGQLDLAAEGKGGLGSGKGGADFDSQGRVEGNLAHGLP